MRAVSLAIGVVAGVVGAGGAAGTEIAMRAGAAAVPMGRGTGVLAAGGGAGGVNVWGAGTPVTDGLGSGTWDIGGRGIGTVPAFGASIVGGGCDVGGPAGRLIRTALSSCGATASPRRGGRVIRTVSFFGSLASAMVTLRVEKRVCQKFRDLSLSIDARTRKSESSTVLVVAVPVTGSGGCCSANVTSGIYTVVSATLG
jgi:hypothetical protein